MHDFRDKAVLVTGSTRGIGLAIAKLLLVRGAIVGIHGRRLSTVELVCNEIARDGCRTIPIACDLSDPDQGSSAVRSFADAAGRIDGLVNNAGSGKAIAFRGLTLDKWQKTFNLNLEAAMMAAREAYVLMRDQGQGSIVNIASLAAHGPGKWMSAAYAASKAGLVSLTKSLAYEAARYGIRVNAVSPGMVETDMTSVLPEETRTSLNIPLGRFASPEEIARVVMFLLSDASGYITGQVVRVDGGMGLY